MGDLLRRYWHPIGTVAELRAEPVQPVRLLSEDLTLFRLADGTGDNGRSAAQSASQPPTTVTRHPMPSRYGLIAQRCAHRGLSLAYGIPQPQGLRCAYHGWTYDPEGHVDMPFEPACLPLQVRAYPVQELSGAIWAYLGPPPVPLLPRWDLLVQENVKKDIRTDVLPCNWLQCVDNTLDPVHFEHLHGTYGNYVMKRLGKPQMMHPARTTRIDFDFYRYGMYKRRLVENEPEDSPDWTIGHPIIFPHILVVPRARGESSLVYRVPIDDEHTLSFIISARDLAAGEARDEEIPVIHDPVEYDQLGRVVATYIGRQDELAFIGQGPIADRTAEHLGTSDVGLVAFRRMLFENLDKVARGEDPIAVIRDPDENYPFISLARGTQRSGFHQGVADEVWGGLDSLRR